MITVIIYVAIAITLFAVSRKRQYSNIESTAWLVAGLLLGFFIVPLFAFRIVADKKGKAVAFASGAMIFIGTAFFIYDVFRVLGDSGIFHKPTLAGASIIGIILIVCGALILTLSGKSKKSLHDKLIELDDLLSNGAISNDEHEKMRQSILFNKSE